MRPTVVAKGGKFLRLDGVFQYPAWTSLVQATRMTLSQASGWANALGGTAVVLDAAGAVPASIPPPIPDLAPDTRREVPKFDIEDFIPGGII